MTVRFSPGPWNIKLHATNELGEVAIFSADDWAMVCRLGGGRTNGYTEADARLIAAAPEMYELLRWSPGSRGGAWTEQAWEELRRALLARIDSKEPPAP